jgi:hypothetical protein
VLGEAARLGLNPIVHVSSTVAFLPGSGLSTQDSPPGEPAVPYAATKADSEGSRARRGRKAGRSPSSHRAAAPIAHPAARGIPCGRRRRRGGDRRRHPRTGPGTAALHRPRSTCGAGQHVAPVDMARALSEVTDDAHGVPERRGRVHL